MPEPADAAQFVEKEGDEDNERATYYKTITK
jgi:hypothetical protein